MSRDWKRYPHTPYQELYDISIFVILEPQKNNRFKEFDSEIDLEFSHKAQIIIPPEREIGV
jgi:hypothetical protein